MDYFILKAKRTFVVDGKEITDYNYLCANNITRQKALIDGKYVDAVSFTCSGLLTVLKAEDVVAISTTTPPPSWQ